MVVHSSRMHWPATRCGCGVSWTIVSTVPKAASITPRQNTSHVTRCLRAYCNSCPIMEGYCTRETSRSFVRSTMAILTCLRHLFCLSIKAGLPPAVAQVTDYTTRAQSAVLNMLHKSSIQSIFGLEMSLVLFRVFSIAYTSWISPVRPGASPHMRSTIA